MSKKRDVRSAVVTVVSGGWTGFGMLRQLLSLPRSRGVQERRSVKVLEQKKDWNS